MSVATAHQSEGTPFDVGHAMDHGEWTLIQKLAVLMAALSIVLDGFDTPLIGLAIPTLMRDWGVGRDAFMPIVAIGLIGMAIGTLTAGRIGDFKGRRTMAIGSVLVFGLATMCIGLAPNIWVVGLFRFIAGVGLGGALPAATTIAAEYTPIRLRTGAVIATIASVPLGGMLAALFAAFILPTFGWRVMFILGGALPVLLTAILYFKLPESPRWLSRDPTRWPELTSVLRSMRRNVPDKAIFVDAVEQQVERKVDIASLFQEGRASSTILLSAAFFAGSLAVYTAYSWLPTMLSAEGLSVSVASNGLTAYNVGSFCGSLIFAVLVSRFGSRWPILFSCLGAAGAAWWLTTIDLSQNIGALAVGFGVHGFFMGATQTTLYALAANAYPTNIRGTGTATVFALGRLGAILSSFIGAAVITAGGASAFLSVLAWSMLAAFIALLILPRHLLGQRREAALAAQASSP